MNSAWEEWGPPPYTSRYAENTVDCPNSACVHFAYGSDMSLRTYIERVVRVVDGLIQLRHGQNNIVHEVRRTELRMRYMTKSVTTCRRFAIKINVNCVGAVHV